MWAPIVHFAILATSLGNMNQTPKDILGSIDSVMSQSRDPAVRALDTFRKLVNEQNYRAMGFDSVSEVRSATIGQPLVEFYVRLDKLREYRPGGNPVSLLDGGDKVIYPVLVGQQVRSSIVLARDSSGWAAASYGGPNATKLLYRTKAAVGGGQYFAVNVLALGLHFLGTRQQGNLVLAPLLDDQQGRWKAGAILPADRVFGPLVEDAKAYNGLPR